MRGTYGGYVMASMSTNDKLTMVEDDKGHVFISAGKKLNNVNLGRSINHLKSCKLNRRIIIHSMAA